MSRKPKPADPVAPESEVGTPQAAGTAHDHAAANSAQQRLSAAELANVEPDQILAYAFSDNRLVVVTRDGQKIVVTA